jgi:hypothetical protein
MSESMLNQTALAADTYAYQEIHKFLMPLLPLLEYRKEVAKRFNKGDENGVAVLENVNKEILKALYIPSF